MLRNIFSLQLHSELPISTNIDFDCFFVDNEFLKRLTKWITIVLWCKTFLRHMKKFFNYFRPSQRITVTSSVLGVDETPYRRFLNFVVVSTQYIGAFSPLLCVTHIRVKFRESPVDERDDFRFKVSFSSFFFYTLPIPVAYELACVSSLMPIEIIKSNLNHHTRKGRIFRYHEKTLAIL